MTPERKLPEWHKYVFVGTHGHVIALNKTTGRKVWATSLPRTGYDMVSILFEDGRLFSASGGRVFALDPATGDIVWKNELKGMGSGLVYLSTVNSNSTEALMSVLARSQQKTKQAAAAAAT